MTDAQLTLAALIFAPVTVIVLTGMFRGYHMRIWLFRPTKHDHHHDDHPEES